MEASTEGTQPKRDVALRKMKTLLKLWFDITHKNKFIRHVRFALFFT